MCKMFSKILKHRKEKKKVMPFSGKELFIVDEERSSDFATNDLPP